MNELILVLKPEDDPINVTTSYQRQNNLLYLLQTGIERTNIIEEGDNIRLLAGGVVEINGNLYKITEEIQLVKPVSTRAYWIGIVPEDDKTASVHLLAQPGSWNQERQGYYRHNSRVLDWMSTGTPMIVDTPIYFNNLKGNHTVTLQAGWYVVNVYSGLGNGPGGDAFSRTWGNFDNEHGVGGVPTERVLRTRMFFNDATRTYNLFIGGSGLQGEDGQIGGRIPGNNTPWNPLAGMFYYAGSGGGGASGAGQESLFYFSQEDILSSGITSRNRGGIGGRSFGNYLVSITGSGSNTTLNLSVTDFVDVGNGGNMTTIATSGGNMISRSGPNGSQQVTGVGGLGGGFSGGGGGAGVTFLSSAGTVSSGPTFSTLTAGRGGVVGLDGEHAVDGTAGGIVEIFRLD